MTHVVGNTWQLDERDNLKSSCVKLGNSFTSELVKDIVVVFCLAYFDADSLVVCWVWSSRSESVDGGVFAQGSAPSHLVVVCRCMSWSVSELGALEPQVPVLLSAVVIPQVGGSALRTSRG